MFQTLSRREEPLDKIDKACRKMEPLYGDGWDMTFERPEPQVFEMKVRRCFFRDFFARHDATLVTTVMCAFDVNWMQAIDPAVSGLRAEPPRCYPSETTSVDSRCSRPTIRWPATSTRSSGAS
jgi:hypothetical protein